MADIRTTPKVEGTQPTDSPVSDNPLLTGGRASTVEPTPVSADGDAVPIWLDRQGRVIVDYQGDVGLQSFAGATAGASVYLRGGSVVAFHFPTGSTGGTYFLQGSTDGTTWVNLPVTDTSGTAVAAISPSSSAYIGHVGGFQFIRFNCTSFSSATDIAYSIGQDVSIVGVPNQINNGTGWIPLYGNVAGAYVNGAIGLDNPISTMNPLVTGGRASTAVPTPVSADNDVVWDWKDRRGATVVVGGDASDAAVSGNPVRIGARASDAVVTPVSADGDLVDLWVSRRGALMVGMAGHVPFDGSPFSLTSKSALYTSAQTGTALVTPTGGKKLVVTEYQIQTTGTVGGHVQLWFGAGGDTTYSRGTDSAVFDGHFVPSATFSPGAAKSGLWIASAADHVLRVTDDAAINELIVTVWYYEI